jgi:hypothetical protein
MVLHGNIEYTGTPINLSVDPETAFLKCVEYGAGLSYCLITGDDISLSGTDYEGCYYSVSSKKVALT